MQHSLNAGGRGLRVYGHGRPSVRLDMRACFPPCQVPSVRPSPALGFNGQTEFFTKCWNRIKFKCRIITWQLPQKRIRLLMYDRCVYGPFNIKREAGSYVSLGLRN